MALSILVWYSKNCIVPKSYHSDAYLWPRSRQFLPPIHRLVVGVYLKLTNSYSYPGIIVCWHGNLIVQAFLSLLWQVQPRQGYQGQHNRFCTKAPFSTKRLSSYHGKISYSQFVLEITLDLWVVFLQAYPIWKTVAQYVGKSGKQKLFYPGLVIKPWSLKFASYSISSSGLVFCYVCIVRYLRKYGKVNCPSCKNDAHFILWSQCPVTSLPSKEGQLVRIFASSEWIK